MRQRERIGERLSGAFNYSRAPRSGSRRPGGLCAIVTGRHHLSADEPVAAGGTDTGPTPCDLLLAALGTCVRFQHSKIHTDDCAGCEPTEGTLDHIEREVELTGHRTLKSEINIRSWLA
jgi:uncharacterized OsmC-like protein